MTNNELDLTYEKACQILEYNPDTGIIIWLNSGDIAGKRYGNHYITINIGDKTYQAHRLAWLLVMQEWPKNQIDHIDHVKYNNKFSNLRDISPQENHKNMPISKNNKSGVSGVNFTYKKWKATIGVNGKTRVLGVYDDFFEACCARLSANNKYGYHANHGK